MPLSVGSRVRQYEITAAIGAGVLPDFFAADADGLARFEREAQVLAALNHPHIAAICGIEESRFVSLA